MELINQHTKKIMEGCKERAWAQGLRFEDETLEYIVTNRDLIELTPKVMIPTLYDYWVQDVEVLKEKGRYELYPSNPYETVVNTRPAISFYNDNNPDWLNVMIFYHVLGHIDFFQNNVYFRHTWDYDFTGVALSDKRLIARLRAEKGRWVDYVIEFALSIDNLSGYFEELSEYNHTPETRQSNILDYYFDVFLQDVLKVRITKYIEEVNRYNQCLKEDGKTGQQTFFLDIYTKYPEFEVLYNKYRKSDHKGKVDLLQFLASHSEFLNKEENNWMKSILEIVRKTSIFFQPQIRTKIMNEGWASYWHETLFLQDDRIKGHEVEFARVNAGVTAMPRVGLNPYALGMRLFYYIEDCANKGRISHEFRRISDSLKREDYDTKSGGGREFIFRIRESMSDFLFINTFVDQDFVTRNNLFVAGKRINEERGTWQYYVKSKKSEDYKQMVQDQLYHPPHITVKEQDDAQTLYLVHHFEEKPLVKDFIANTMMGIEYLWGGPVQLETSEVASITTRPSKDHRGAAPFMSSQSVSESEQKIRWRRVLYLMKDRKFAKKTIT